MLYTVHQQLVQDDAARHSLIQIQEDLLDVELEPYDLALSAIGAHEMLMDIKAYSPVISGIELHK